MARAQKRNAAIEQKFYFRKFVDVGTSSPASEESGGACGPDDGELGSKPKAMQNCFPPLPKPVNGGPHVPVEDEYEEMSMAQIVNGNVRERCKRLSCC
jgi:glutamate--cysteine ligase catalytic subunit